MVLGRLWPVTWEGALSLLGRGRRRYLCLRGDLEPRRLLAAIEPWDSPGALGKVVAEAVAGNDLGFGSLPHEISNHRPDLLPTSLLKQALFDCQRCLASLAQRAWALLAGEVYGRAIEPNHLTRLSDLLATFPGREAKTAEERDRAINSWLPRAGLGGAAPPRPRPPPLDDESHYVEHVLLPALAAVGDLSREFDRLVGVEGSRASPTEGKNTPTRVKGRQVN